MLNLIRRLAAHLSEPEDERTGRSLRGPLVCKLITDLDYLDSMTRGPSAARR